MMEWIQQYEAGLMLAVQATSMVVWIAYLQVFVTSFRRQRRSNIFVNRVAGNRDRAHLLVGNMGAEPIYVSAIIADVYGNDAHHSAVVTERDGTDADGASSSSDAGPSELLSATRQGPLRSAEYRDAGSFRSLIDRTLATGSPPLSSEDVTSVTITVAAESTHDSYLVAGQQSFWVRRNDDGRVFIPQATRTRQIRGRRARRHLADRMKQALQEEAQRFLGTSATPSGGLASVA
ncbi:hypothetical protein ROJ8625_00326 [Roseivivax jejudonensis]|uniref:Uncharacterized protein n=1 Tax=Roseivivax jejudonensis TaxID=1529041 RepID=A0A1X6Y6X5_9RHOB|nr:hypothetical protein [Roseivivax jejudonensis]SLN12345.1 hypothetical protein ROJ8625_00326 [Roseivivax jejudonensis]